LVIVDADTGNYLGGTGNSDARTGNFTCQYPKSSLDEVFGTHTHHFNGYAGMIAGLSRPSW
jgi:hypothetical protein